VRDFANGSGFLFWQCAKNGYFLGVFANRGSFSKAYFGLFRGFGEVLFGGGFAVLRFCRGIRGFLGTVFTEGGFRSTLGEGEMVPSLGFQALRKPAGGELGALPGTLLGILEKRASSSADTCSTVMIANLAAAAAFCKKKPLIIVVRACERVSSAHFFGVEFGAR
jgi:hypothetical protein